MRENSSHQGLWDLAYLIWGAAMLIGGWLLARAGESEQVQEQDGEITDRRPAFNARRTGRSG